MSNADDAQHGSTPTTGQQPQDPRFWVLRLTERVVFANSPWPLVYLVVLVVVFTGAYLAMQGAIPFPQ